ncbi:hypothetical protein HMI56_002316 [Coelomomyces lativittatus]|nr:hypothetical protein HMI56_002316 [Coelomomyces lativittatus]
MMTQLLSITVEKTKALIIGAAIAPTDPVLANSIVKGAFADRHVSLHIRHLLSGESACNDCTAAPFLYLSILLDQSQPWTKVLFEFSLYHLLYELGVGAVLGAIMGYTFRKALHYSKRHDLIDQENFLSFTLALSFLANGSAYLLKANDFLAVLSAAIAFSWDGKFSQLTSTSQIQEVLDNLVNAFFFILLGAVLPWPSITVGLIEFWKYLVASILILLFRRIPMTFLMYPILSSLTSPMEALFVGHFGPMAVGSVYYLQVILHKADVPLANDFILFIVFLSILVHGMTVPLFQISTVAMRTFSGSHSPHITHIRRISVTKGITISAPLHLHPFHSDTLNSKDTVTLEISEEEECVSELELETTVRTTEESHQIT